MIHKALELHRRGDLVQAKAAYKSVLDLDEKNFDALHLLGVLYVQSGNLNKGLKFIDKAIGVNPKNMEAHFNKAEALYEARQFGAALEIYNELIKVNLDDQDCHFKIISAFRELNKIQDALDHLDRVINRFPENFLYHHTKGDILSQIDKGQDAILAYTDAIQRNPNFALSYNNRAILFKHNGNFENALEDLSGAIRLAPLNEEYHFNLGNLYKSVDQFDLAIQCYHEALAINPNYLEAHFNLANTYLEVEKFAEAAVGYDHVLRLDQSHAHAHRNRGISLQKLNRHDDALESLNKAIDLGAKFPDAFLARSAIFSEIGQFENSLKDKRAYLEFYISHKADGSQFLNLWMDLISIDSMPPIFRSQTELGDTRNKIESILDKLINVYSNGIRLTREEIDLANRAIVQFNGFYIAYHQLNDRETMRKISFILQWLSGATTDFEFKGKRLNAPIRIGVASQRLRNHNGANWAYNWLVNLPQTNYEFFTYNFEMQSDEVSTRFSELGTHRQLKLDTADHSKTIELIRNDNLDFLMLPDVGMTPISRILSIHRLAPRQFTAWGHPVTTGSSTVDFYLSSDFMEPADGQEHYTEKLVRMPNLALFLEPRKLPEPSGIVHDFPVGRVLFGCVQSLFKYIPKYDHLFPLIAQQVPDALFIFIRSNYGYMTDIFQTRLKHEFERHGLDFDHHVKFVSGMDQNAFSNLLMQMDVCIDSVGWTGGNTTIECVELGVPFATLPGEFMRGRHSYAILKMMQCDELIARSFEDYVSLLAKLGLDRNYRRHVSELFKSRCEMIYKDQAFINAFHDFLITNTF